MAERTGSATDDPTGPFILVRSPRPGHVVGQRPRVRQRDPRAFACDGMALALAQEAVRVGADQAVPPGSSF